MSRPLLIVAILTLACAALAIPVRSTPPTVLSDAGGEWKCTTSALVLTTCTPDRDALSRSTDVIGPTRLVRLMPRIGSVHRIAYVTAPSPDRQK